MNDLEACLFELWLTEDHDDLLREYRMKLAHRLRRLEIANNPGIIYPTPVEPPLIDPDWVRLRWRGTSGVMRLAFTNYAVAARSINEMLGRP